jgi:sensor histidine kinase YesM
MKGFKQTSKVAFIVGIAIFVIERLFSGNSTNESNMDLFLYFIITQLYSFIIAFSIGGLNLYLNKHLSWKNEPKKRLIIGSLTSIILIMFIIVILRIIVVMVFFGQSFQDFLNTSKYYYIFSLIVTVNILIIMHAIYFFRAMTDKKVTKHKVIGKTETAKFESLKNQLDPHFLFNSLNVLTSLIGENPKQAEKFTTKLSKIYRYVLTQKSEDLVLVNDELKFAKTYMDLIKMRFEDAVTFEIPDQLSNENLKIIPLSLQLLLENAVKHNVITSTKKLTIKMYEKDNYLVIENNINPKTSLEKGTKIGLKNIINRYSLVTKRSVVIESNEKLFKVKLPLLTQKTNIMNNIFNQEEKYHRAKNKVKSIKEFYQSLIAFIFVIPMLFYIWNTYTPHIIQWFWFPFFGWGLGLAIQGFQVFSTTTDWEKRKIKKFMDQDDYEQNDIKF